MIRVNDAITLDESEIEFTFVRSGGPGGQNVNKVATAVQLRFDVIRSPSIPPEVRETLLRTYKRRITRSGYLLIRANRHRTQERNRADAVDRLVEMIRACATARKKRLKTRPTASSRRRRLEGKRRRGEVKRSRGTPRDDA